MTNTKRISYHKLLALLLGFLLTALLLCALAPKAYAAASGTVGTCSWTLDDDGNLVIRPANGPSGTISRFTNWCPWRSYSNSVKTIRFEPGVKITADGGGCLFLDLSQVTSIDLSNCEFAGTTTRNMFAGCSSLTSITGLDSWNMTQVTDMNRMFYGCRSLTSLDVSGFNTAKVTNMEFMFSGCTNLTSLDVSRWDTSKVTRMWRMFETCRSLTSLDVSGWNTSNVTDMRSMFSGCSSLTSLDVSNFNTAKVTGMSYMFSDCSGLTSLDVSNFNTAKVTNMEYMFSGCSGLTSLDVSNFDTSNVSGTSYTGMTSMFKNCSGLTSLDVSNFDTSNVSGMSSMFSGCSGLTSLDVSNFNTAKVTEMSSMFKGCSGLTSLDVTSFDTAQCQRFQEMFRGCRGLTVLDLRSFDTRNVAIYNYPYQYMIQDTNLQAIAIGPYTMGDSSTVSGFSEIYSYSQYYGVIWEKFAELNGKQVFNGEQVAQLYRAKEYPGWYKRANSPIPPEFNLYAEFTSEEDEQTEYWEKKGNEWSYTFYVYDDTKTYYIWEDPVDGFSAKDGEGTASNPIVITPDEATGKIPAVVSLLNIGSEETGSITLNKLVSDGSGGSFRFNITLTGDKITGTQKFGSVTFNNGSGYVYLSHGESVTLENIPVGTNFYISEETPGGYTCDWLETPSGVIEVADQAFGFTCVNTPPPPPPPPGDREYVDLTVTKIVTGHYSHANPFTFTASFSGLDLYADYNYTVAGVSGSFTASETGEAYVTFALADGESASFLQIPENARYQISEDGGDWTASYLVTDSNGGSSIVSTGGSAGIGKPLSTALETADRGEAITIAYTNVLEKTEDISIKKVVVVPEGQEASDDSFTFTVNFEGLTPGAYYNSDVGTIRADADGVAERSFSLKAGEQFFFYGLPVGATYRFTEAAGPYIAAFTVTDSNGGTTIVKPDGANAKSRTDLATGTETVDEGESIVVTFTNTPVPLRDIDVQKIWNDANDQDGMRPKSIDVQLTANGKALGSPVTLTRSMGWAYTWTDLDKLDESGNEIDYAVEELTISKDTTATNGKYTTATTGDMTEGFTITNTHEPEKTSVPVRKVWSDANNQDGKRPESVTVVLLADGKEVGKKLVLRKANQWSGVFENLPKYSEGKEIVYTVREESVSGYTVAITGDAAEGYEVTNTRDPETTTIGGRKIWKDNNNLNQIRPDSVTVRLRADGQEIASAVVSAQTNWSYSFKDLPVYKNGAKIVYTVSEDAVPGYTTKILDNYNIENSYTPGKTGVNVTKVWDDQNDKDHMRPLEIKVQLLADGKKFGDPVALNAANKWTYSWTDLDDSKDGVAITYTVREISVKGYTTELVGSAETGFVLINHHTVVPEIEILVRKVWDDQNNRDRIRPSEIRVQLLANGRRVGNPVSLNATNKWSYIWTGLPESQDGKVIVYTVRETAVRGYTAELSGSAATGFVLINHHTPGVIPRPGIIPRTGETNLLPVTIPAMGVSGLGMILSAIFGKKRKSRKNK